MFFKNKRISELEKEVESLKNELEDMDTGYRTCVEMLTEQIVFLNSYCLCLSESTAVLCDQLGVSWVDIIKETARKLVELPKDSVENSYSSFGLKKEDLN